MDNGTAPLPLTGQALPHFARFIQLAGATAAMFGGLAAQQKLFAEVEAH